MKKISMLLATAFAFAASGAQAVPKAAEHPGGEVVAGTANGATPKVAAKKAVTKKPAKKAAKQK